MDDVQIRQARVDDVPVLLDLIHTAFAEYQGNLDPPSGAHRETVASLRGYFDDERALLATVDGAPAGCVFYVPQDNVLYVHRLAVPPAWRRRGIGRTLMAAADAEGRALGKTSVRVGVRTVLVGNKLFYEDLGYRIAGLGRHPGYDVITFYHMEKPLTPDAVPASKHMRNIHVVPHDPTWAEMFAEEAVKLRAAFGAELVTIHHIGSTAIAGIDAKPVIDILPVVRDITRVDQRNPWLVSLGYEPRGENFIPGRRYFCKEHDGVRTHHVHVFQAGHPEIDRHVDFCAYLNAHPADAHRYAALKRALAAQFPQDIMGYNEGKTALIRELDAKAAAWKVSQP